MSTFEHDPVIASLASRARDQVQAGLKELHAGNLLAAEVFLNAACATMQSLVVLLDSPAPAKPMRKLAVVRAPPGGEVSPAVDDERWDRPAPSEDKEPDWFERKANSGDDDDAA